MHLDYRPSVAEDNEDTVVGTVNGTVNDPLLQTLMADPTLSYDALPEQLGMSRRTVARRIKMLVEQGVLVRNGSDKAGRWHING